jgi:hypothetical protein
LQAKKYTVEEEEMGHGGGGFVVVRGVEREMRLGKVHGSGGGFVEMDLLV